MADLTGLFETRPRTMTLLTMVTGGALFVGLSFLLESPLSSAIVIALMVLSIVMTIDMDEDV